MENPETSENVSAQTVEATINGSTPRLDSGQAKPTTKGKKKMKRHCPVCGKRLYQDGSERWYCPHCLAEVDGDRISFNFVPEGELDTQLLTG